MIFIIIAMLVILVLAGLVVVYVAYPHRGQEMPNAPWVGEALKRTVDAVPTLPGEGEPDGDHHADDEQPR